MNARVAGASARVHDLARRVGVDLYVALGARHEDTKSKVHCDRKVAAQAHVAHVSMRSVDLVDRGLDQAGHAVERRLLEWEQVVRELPGALKLDGNRTEHASRAI